MDCVFKLYVNSEGTRVKDKTYLAIVWLHVALLISCSTQIERHPSSSNDDVTFKTLPPIE